MRCVRCVRYVWCVWPPQWPREGPGPWCTRQVYRLPCIRLKAAGLMCGRQMGCYLRPATRQVLLSGEGPAPPHRDAEKRETSEVRPICSLSGDERPARQTRPRATDPPSQPQPGVTRTFPRPPCASACWDAGLRARPKRLLFFFGELIFSSLNAHKSLDNSPAFRFC